MIIGVDGNEANVDKKVGISEYAFRLLVNFSKLSSKDKQFVIYLKKKPNSELPHESEYFNYKVFGPTKLWTQFALPLSLFISGKRLDIFFTPSHYAPRFSKVPTAISLMDVSYLKYPELFAKKDYLQLKSWTEYSVRKASKVFTISKSSKNDILKAYNLEAEKVAVTYPGVKSSVTLTPMVYNMKQLVEKYDIADKYFLFVGTLQPRKNIVRLIEAFSQIDKDEHKGLQLLIVGKKGWQFDEILSAPEKYGVEKSVKFLDFVTDEELGILYAHAVAYVLPSLYEGFGLPILEAFEHDCPVITSNLSSLPEAAGEAALFIDPESVTEIKKAMQKMLIDSSLRKKLIQEGRKQLEKFSWEKTAKETLSVFEEVVKKP